MAKTRIISLDSEKKKQLQRKLLIAGERESFRRLMCDVYPSGILSLVSDSWDLWSILTEILPSLKKEIMSRDGKIVVRPDSGNPVDIICGIPITDLTSECDTFENFKLYCEEELVEFVTSTTPHGEYGQDTAEGIFKFGNKHYQVTVAIEWNRYDKQYYYVDSSKLKFCQEVKLTPVQKGVIELLWDEFGGTVNTEGYKVLDSHIGAIYGDSITLDRADQICKRLKDKGFASSNIVFGIGSYTFSYVTRDTLGLAMKATYCEVNGEGREIFKDPITDDGTKKSLKGLLKVYKEDGVLKVKDQVSWDEEAQGELKTVFEDGCLLKDFSLKEVRENLAKSLEN